jgi:hypothetical protein
VREVDRQRRRLWHVVKALRQGDVAVGGARRLVGVVGVRGRGRLRT